MPSPFTSKHIEKEREWVDPIPVRVKTRRKQTKRDQPPPRSCPTRSKPNDEGLNPFPFALRRQGGVEHSPDTSKHVETKWGGLNPSPPPSRWPNRSDEEGKSLLVTSLRTCQRVENNQGGVEPSLVASKHVENRGGGDCTLPVRVETRRVWSKRDG